MRPDLLRRYASAGCDPHDLELLEELGSVPDGEGFVDRAPAS